MSRTMTSTTVLDRQQVHNATTRAPSTSQDALSSNAHEWHHLSQSSDGGRYHPEQRETHLTRPQRRAKHPSHPPPHLRPKTIPLPALSDVPISVNPLLSYNTSKVSLEYDLRMLPITAHLPPIAKAHANHRDWRLQPAMNPSTVGSVTIVVPGLERVVVVLPSALDSDVVTVGNVLVAVYRALQESAFAYCGEFRAKPGVYRGRNFPPAGRADLTANSCTSAIEELGEEHWWAGLEPCQTERDVWIPTAFRSQPRHPSQRLQKGLTLR